MKAKRPIWARFNRTVADDSRAGLSADDIAEISDHSTRVDAAQDTLRYSEQLPGIIQAGRWQTATMAALHRQASRPHLRRGRP
jgi:hypothetical protein